MRISWFYSGVGAGLRQIQFDAIALPAQELMLSITRFLEYHILN
jgi:hypothetical protein